MLSYKEWKLLQESAFPLGIKSSPSISGIVGSKTADFDDDEGDEEFEDQDDVEGEEGFEDHDADDVEGEEEFEDHDADDVEGEEGFEDHDADDVEGPDMPTAEFPPEDSENWDSEIPEMPEDDDSDSDQDIDSLLADIDPELAGFDDSEVEKLDGMDDGDPCPDCNPEGDHDGSPDCVACDGSGYLKDSGDKKFMGGAINTGMDSARKIAGGALGAVGGYLKDKVKSAVQAVPSTLSSMADSPNRRNMDSDCCENDAFLNSLARQARGNKKAIAEDSLIPSTTEPGPGDVGYAPQGRIGSMGGGYTQDDLKSIPTLGENHLPTLEQYIARKRHRR